jgi:hydrogenase expression/formation protein HypC
MCLSVPAEILEIDGMRAKVSVGGATYYAGLHLVEDVRVGDYILIHSGYAIQKIDPEEAQETLELLREMSSKAAEYSSG